MRLLQRHLGSVARMTFLLLCVALPNASQATILLSLSDGGSSVVNYSFSSSGTIASGFAVSSVTSSRIRLPEDGSWSSFFTSGDFDDAGSALLGVTNLTAGTFAATGSPAVFVDGVRVGLDGGGFPASGEWEIQFSDDPGFRFEATVISNFLYPALSGGEVVSVSGSGSFDVGSGDFTDNFNVGSYLFAGASGLDFAITVSPSFRPIPEPSTMALLVIGLIGVAGASSKWGRRSRTGSDNSERDRSVIAR